MTVTFIMPGSEHAFRIWGGAETPAKEDIVTLVDDYADGAKVRVIIVRREWSSPSSLVCTVRSLQ